MCFIFSISSFFIAIALIPKENMYYFHLILSIWGEIPTQISLGIDFIRFECSIQTMALFLDSSPFWSSNGMPWILSFLFSLNTIFDIYNHGIDRQWPRLHHLLLFCKITIFCVVVSFEIQENLARMLYLEQMLITTLHFRKHTKKVVQQKFWLCS